MAAPAPPLKNYIGLAILSAALIAYQLALMELLSIMQWHHFAYMVISVAMMGFGAAGTLLTMYKKWFMERYHFLMPLFLLLSGLFMGLNTWFIQLPVLNFDSYLVFDSWNQRFKLLFNYLLFFLPFLFGAFGIGFLFVREVSKIGVLYFANLFGSGIGGGLAVLLMWYFMPPQLPSIIGAIVLLSGIVFISKYKSILTALTLTFATALGIILFFPPQLKVSQFKSFSKTMDLPEAKIIWERNSPYGLMQEVSAPAIRYAPGLSLSYLEEIPVNSMVFNNGQGFGPLVLQSPQDSLKILKFVTSQLPYEFGDVNKVLVLGAGTGWEVLQALKNNAETVQGIESHPLVFDLYNEKEVKWVSHGNLELYHADPRTFIEVEKEDFDLIVIPTLNSFGGNAGLNAMGENYLMTTDALQSAWDHLNLNGMISITTWVDYPPRYPLKVLASLKKILIDNNVSNPPEHIAAIRGWGTITFIAKRSVLTESEIRGIRNFCNEKLFDPALLPGLKEEERAQFNQLQDDKFFTYLDEILIGDINEFDQTYDFKIKPVSDNKPYFDQFLKLGSLTRLSKIFGEQSVPYIELGYLIVIVTFLQVTLMGILLIFLPLARLGWKGGDKKWIFFYFSSIGIGFLFIEMVLIQKLSLYLGHPIYSAAAVITTLLIFSGIGSYLSSFKSSQLNFLKKTLFSIVILVLIYFTGLQYILDQTMTFSLPTKVIIILGSLAPLGILMGMPFPLGLGMVARKNEANVPWAWGINGYFSVISTVLATILSLEFGFSSVFLLAAASYLITLITLVFMNRPAV